MNKQWFWDQNRNQNYSIVLEQFISKPVQNINANNVKDFNFDVIFSYMYRSAGSFDYQEVSNPGAGTPTKLAHVAHSNNPEGQCVLISSGTNHTQY